MKLITKLAAGAFVAIAFMAWQNDRNNPGGNEMERLHADVGVNQMSCTESEYDGHRWMACRYPNQESNGSLWAWHENTRDGAWIPRNDLAHRVARESLARENAGQPLAAPIGKLNSLKEENVNWWATLPAAPWAHLD